MGEVLAGELTGNPSPNLETLNQKCIKKLYDLVESLDEHSEPDMILACIKGVSQLNASVRGNEIFSQKESDEERSAREKAELVGEILKKSK